MKRLALSAVTATAIALAGAATAQTIEHIRESGEIRLGFRTDAAPMSFLDANNTPAGYTPQVCGNVAELIAIDLDLDELTATFIPVTAENRFEKVANGEIDLLCGAATITIGRRETVDFSLPVFVDGVAVLLPKDASKEMSALAGKKIGVRAGTTTQTILANSLRQGGVEAEIVPFDAHDAGLAALEKNEIAAYFGDQSIIYGLLHESDLSQNFAMSDNTLTIEKQGLALRRGDPDFRLAVDRALSQLYSSGTMAKIFRATFPGAEPGIALQALFTLAPELP
jgi:polar amino acid transport system substrate-binding protein